MDIVNEKIEVNFPMASRWKRVWAFLVDMVIAGLISTTGSLFGIYVIFKLMSFQEVEFLHGFGEGSVFIYFLVMMLSYIWFIAYILLRDSFGKGQSFGKRLFGLKVIKLDNGLSCSPGDSFMRNLPGFGFILLNYFLPIFTFPFLLIEPVTIFRSLKGQRIGDCWARTQVIDIKQHK
ncbi:RDD family protein [Candidatus Contubernalis alkaliaceticus]|uniref:RDD family protein n=1 Tax=Candidatus Contubernalis alkaliaceticus TaxID=338645 RepID=UPI001F4C4F6C|nr:RDD family protein [Candidatus Contubernalis alkalaceticus]UNC91018.1 RDD family protein [Candidatus Contubernalis alkalaceticus]